MTTPPENSFHSTLKVYVIRLKPKDDLKKSLQDFAVEHKIKAAIILTCVGSVEGCNLRFANAKTAHTLSAYFEIVSLVGTLSDTACHLHLSVSKTTGEAIGGHLMEGNIIYTTAEVAIGVLPDLVFERIADDTYGFHELKISTQEIRKIK